MRNFVRGILLFFFLFVVASKVDAVTKTSANITVTLDEPLFSSSIIWYPTRSETKTVAVTNISGELQYLGQGARNVSTSPGANIAAVLDLEVSRQSDGNVLWTGTLQDLYDGGEIGLGTILPGETKTYIYTVAMRDVSNEYQGKSTSFDLDIGYIGQAPTNTPTPTNTPAPQPGSSNSGGGGGTSQSTSSPGGGTGEVLGEAQSNPFRSLVRSVRSAFGIAETDENTEADSQPTPTPEEPSENILGEQDDTCQNAPWWWLVILIYGAIGVLFYGLGKRIERIVRILVHGLFTVAAIVLLVYALCNWVFAVILTAIIGIITQLLIESHAQE